MACIKQICYVVSRIDLKSAFYELASSVKRDFSQPPDL